MHADLLLFKLNLKKKHMVPFSFLPKTMPCDFMKVVDTFCGSMDMNSGFVI